MKIESTDDSWPPTGWDRQSYEHGNHSHTFYVVNGKSFVGRRSVLLLHEFPGISRTVEEFVNMLATDFRVLLPSIFGRDGAPTLVDSLKQICVRREVHLIARGAVSKDVAWLKGFVDAHVADGDAGFGVIGMCFSGNFALALAVDDRVKAAVVAQPALPLWPPSLGLSGEDQITLRAREDLRVRGYRYRGDCRSPGVKLKSAQRLVGDARIRTFTFPAPLGRHSTLTGKHPSESALYDVRDFLRSALKPAQDPTSPHDIDPNGGSHGT